MKKSIAITLISILTITAVILGALYYTNNTQKTKEIEDLRTESAGKTDRIGQLNEDIGQLDASIQTLQSEKEEQEALINQLNSDIETQAGEIEALNAAIQEKDADIEALNTDISEKTLQIDGLNADVAGKEASIQSLNTELTDRSSQIESLNSIVAGQQTQIETLTAEIGEKGIQVEILASALEEKGQQIEAYLAAADEKDRMITSLTGEIETVTAEAQKELEETVNAVKSEAELEKAKAVEEAVKAAREEFENARNDRNGTIIIVEETEQGFWGEVTVTAALDGKTVRALTVKTPFETTGLGRLASEEAFTSQFIGKEGPFTYGENGVDALTGATVTSNAVLKALNRAIPGEDATEEPKAEEAEAPAEEAGRVIYGSYSAKRETNFSTIRVSIDTKEGKITDCKITSEAKMENSDFLTDEIREAWAKAIVENGTADVDVITGASLKFSSEAVVDAVNEILGRIR